MTTAANPDIQQLSTSFGFESEANNLSVTLLSNLFFFFFLSIFLAFFGFIDRVAEEFGQEAG